MHDLQRYILITKTLNLGVISENTLLCFEAAGVKELGIAGRSDQLIMNSWKMKDDVHKEGHQNAEGQKGRTIHPHAD